MTDVPVERPFPNPNRKWCCSVLFVALATIALGAGVGYAVGDARYTAQVARNAKDAVRVLARPCYIPSGRVKNGQLERTSVLVNMPTERTRMLPVTFIDADLMFWEDASPTLGFCGRYDSFWVLHGRASTDFDRVTTYKVEPAYIGVIFGVGYTMLVLVGAFATMLCVSMMFSLYAERKATAA